MSAPPPERPFRLDPFQVEAIAAIDRGENVLVAAPTGSGKTVVAEHAVASALDSGGKAFYTAPIKALSNQKYRDLVERHGSAAVGLLTGDTTRNGDAPIVVMTTEVLRNMLYRRAPALDGLRWVVLDEVHFLQDEYRGPVWEEVMIHLAHEVRLVCLSATVSNSAELGEWITTVRGPTSVVLEERRPVRLTNHYLVERRDRDELVMIPTLVDGAPNRDGPAFDAGASAGRGRGRSRRPFATPRRVDVVERLARDGLLPAIFFIFSRAACDDAVRGCVTSGVRFTTEDDRRRIVEIVEAHTASVDPADLAVLDYERWLHALECGVAAHHAGMVPPFKEAVEACFVEGLVRVVFATETLALGINMPARTVVIEKLTKFTGETHEFLTPAQYTQLTGRAGRRGIDHHGHAVVLWSPFVPFSSVATLVASRRFVLTSAFRPTYNMAANLVRRYDPEHAHRLLNLSFAQFQTDQAVVRVEVDLEDRLERLASARAALEEAAGGPVAAAAVLDDVTLDPGERPAGDRPPGDPAAVEAITAALARLVPGEVVALPRGRHTGTARRGAVRPAVVLSVAHRSKSVRLRVMGNDGRVRSVGPAELGEPPVVVGRLSLPVPFAPDNPAFQKEVAVRLRRTRLPGLARLPDESVDLEADPEADGHPNAARDRGPNRADPADLARLARLVRRHERTVRSLERQVQQRSESLARRFDQILGLLEAWGYVEGWSLTDKGDRLSAIYHECDLLVAEAASEGLFDDLDAPALAGLVSCLTYEHRSSAPPPEPWFPSVEVGRRAHRLERLAHRLASDERAARIPPTRAPDPGFVALAHAWVSGDDLETVLDDAELSAGDFVRNMKQLIDLLRQVSTAAPTAALATTARRAVDDALRGVVLASTLASGVPDDLLDDPPAADPPSPGPPEGAEP